MGAISGIGGGIIIKPLLDTFFALKPQEINFLSGTTVLTMSFFTLLQNRIKKKKLNDRRSIILAAGALLGGIAGKAIFTAVIKSGTGNLVIVVQSGILAFLCAMVFIYMIFKNRISPLNIRNVVICFALGFLMGMISAFLGIGGGPINIMIISYFLGLDSKTTGHNSIYIVFLSQLASLVSSVITGSIPDIPAAITITMLSGGVMGGLAGSGISNNMNNKQVDAFFRIILVCVMLFSVFSIVKFSI